MPKIDFEAIDANKDGKITPDEIAAHHKARIATADRHRARQCRRLDALDEVPEPADAAAGAEAGLIEADRMTALAAGLALLPKRQRQAVVLRHIEGLTNAEIAQILEIGIDAVESLTARGKRALVMALSGQRTALGYEEVS